MAQRKRQSERQSVEVAETPVGQGVFACRRFAKGQVIGEICGRVIDDDPDYGSDYCMDLGDGRLLEPDAPFRYLNHCCQPNCELFFWDTEDTDDPPTDRLWLHALTAIQTGEQLTIDYAWSADVAIPCACHSPICRGWIVSVEELPVLRRRQAAARRTGSPTISPTRVSRQ